MAIYKFKVSDPAGKVSELLIEGESQTDATRRLQRRGVVPLEFLGQGTLSPTGGRAFGLGRRFDVIDFTDRLVPLLQAHIPLEKALAILGEGMEDSFSATVIGDLRKGLHEGKKFSDLIRDRGRLFPRMYASVVEAGEEAGALPQVMADLRTFLMENREMRAFIVSASIYPVVVLLVSISVVTVLLGMIVPKFAAILAGAGREIPASTQTLLDVSHFVQTYWWVFPVLLVGCVLLVIKVQEEGKLRQLVDRLMLKLPIFRQAALLSNLARMARTMAILMRSGVHLLDTVAISARVLENTQIRQSIAGLASELRQGQRLSTALGDSKFVPSFMLRMLAVGEETGAVETMLERVAERYESEFKRLIRRVMSLFEPATIIVLGLLVASIVISMFMAIMDLQGGT